MNEFNNIVKEIIENEEFQRRKEYEHHYNESVYDHSIKVAYLSYKICKKLKFDYKNAAIGGLLHDFYKEPWLINGKLNVQEKKSLFQKHGFVHAKEGAENARQYFPQLLNKKVDNIIRRHMFPLNIIPPIYIEGWIVVVVDKYVSLSIFKQVKMIPKYLGIEKKR